jgi:hypothetical protein
VRLVTTKKRTSRALRELHETTRALHEIGLIDDQRMAEFDALCRRDSAERNHEQDRAHLRELLLQGATSTLAGPADKAYIDGLRDRIRVSTIPSDVA